MLSYLKEIVNNQTKMSSAVRIYFCLPTISVAVRVCDFNCKTSIVVQDYFMVRFVYECVSMWVSQFEYVFFFLLVIKAKPGTSEYLPTGPETHIQQTTPHGEKPACLVPLACMTVYGLESSLLCEAQRKKKNWRQPQQHHWGNQRRENNVLASK